MKAWVVVALLLAIGWAGWARRRVRDRQLARLVADAGTSPARGRRAVLRRHLPALAVAAAALACAVLAQHRHLPWARVALCLVVLAGYPPYASALAPARMRRSRRGPAERMTRLGAPPQVARAIAEAGRPFAWIGSLVLLAAVLILVWPAARTGA